MNITWDLDTAEWWIAGIGLAVGFVFLVLAIIALVAYTRMKDQRDEALSELEAARSDLDEARAELEEKRAELEGKNEELDEARRQLEHANRRMLPRLEIHTARMSELMEMLKSTREDRQKLGELIAGYRKWADKGLGVLKRVVERPRFRSATDSSEIETPED